MEGDERLFEWRIDLPQYKQQHDHETKDNGRDHRGRFPWVDATSPAKAQEEDQEATCHEEKAKPIEILQPITDGGILIVTVLLLEGWGKVEKNPADEGSAVDSEDHPVDPAPSDGWVSLDKRVGNRRCHAGPGNREEV